LTSTPSDDHITANNLTYSDLDQLEECNQIKQSSNFTWQLTNIDGNPVKDADNTIAI
jgi:hypothetical protein